MADIFIAYAREDRDWVEALSQALEVHGWNVWWDTRLAAVERIDEIVKAELQEASCVILLWSRQSVDSEYVIAEAIYGLRRDKLVHVLIDTIEPPLPFQIVRTINMVGWNGKNHDNKFQRVANEVSRILDPPPIVSDQLSVLLSLEEELKRRVAGQEQVIEDISMAIRLSFVGMSKRTVPLGIFLFIGPSGVGKTELANALAELLLGDEQFLVMLNMKEYQTKRSSHYSITFASHLINSNPEVIEEGEERDSQ